MSNMKVAARELYRPRRVHEAVASPGELNDVHFERFRREGFLAVDGVYSPAELESAKAALSFLVGGGLPDFDGISFEPGVDVTNLSSDAREPFVRKLMFFVDHEPRLKAMAQKPAMVDVVIRIIGSAVTMIQDMALLKPAHIGTEKPWHQDAAYFAVQPLELILGTWTALDDANLDNGCMHVIPGSHRAGPVAHYHDRDCQIPDDAVDTDQVVAVPLRPGGVMFFSGLLHHGTPPNVSPARRRALQFHFASVNCRRTDAAAHAKYFHDARGYAACATVQKPRGIEERAQ
jgi:phytanoyl-CoA hydroxylase